MCSCAPPYCGRLVSPQTFERICKSYILKTSDSLIYIPRRKFVEFFVVAKDDDCHIDGAEDGKLVRLLEQTAFPLEKRAGRGDQ